MYVSYIHTVYMHFLIETAPTKGPLDGHEMNRKMRQTIYIYTCCKPTQNLLPPGFGMIGMSSDSKTCTYLPHLPVNFEE